MDLNKACRRIAKENQIDLDLVKKIVMYEFQYTKDIMQSDNTEDILFNKLFKFKLKTRYKENKNQKYTSK